MRRFPVAVGGMLLLVLLTGCGSEAGPTPKQGGEPGPDALPTKLDALSADQCYRSPRTQLPQGCEKYVTELGGTAGAVRKRAGTADQALLGQADALDRGIAAFRGASCTTVPTPGGACTQALTDMANAVTAIKKLVKIPATTG